MSGKPDIWAVLPVKEIDDAKSRLAAKYSPAFRQGLARAMVHDVLSTPARVPELAGIAVVTRDPYASDLARRHGAEIFEDGARDGHTGAVTAAIRRQAVGGHRHPPLLRQTRGDDIPTLPPPTDPWGN